MPRRFQKELSRKEVTGYDNNRNDDRKTNKDEIHSIFGGWLGQWRCGASVLTADEYACR